MRSAVILGLVLICLLLPGIRGVQADEFFFDIEEFQKKPWHLGGYVELRPVLFGLDRDAAFYRLRFLDRDEGKTISERNVRVQLEGRYEQGIARFFARLNTDYRASAFGETLQATFYDAYLTLAPSHTLSLHTGKKSLRWGKGYAWNPVAFFDRPKDPDDPELNLEGFILATADVIKSYSGPLQTLSFSPVLLPVAENINDDFGKEEHINVGGKLYALLYDTDIDLLFLVGGSKNNRYGVDFTRNITSNFAIHGEWARIRNVERRLVNVEGEIFDKKAHATSYLLGLRYLTEAETTWIAEYYHNGSGFSRSEMRHYFALVHQGYEEFQATGESDLLQSAARLARQGYGGMNPMRDYLYVRASQKEPFDILYFTPSLTSIINLADGSFSLAPELLYTGITNLELRLKTTWLNGGRLSEYGEKQNDYRLELRARYTF